MITATLETPSAGLGQALAGKYLTFRLGDESYGIALLKILEIIRMAPITVVPRLPEHVKGMLNLCGKAIPIVDLRLKFELASVDTAERICIVVVQVALPGASPVNMGFIVDGVESIANITAPEIEPASDVGGQICADCVRGMARLDGRVVALLDIDKVMDAEEIAQLSSIAR